MDNSGSLKGEGETEKVSHDSVITVNNGQRADIFGEMPGAAFSIEMGGSFGEQAKNRMIEIIGGFNAS